MAPRKEKRSVRTTFDRSFYDRYYERSATAVVKAEEVQRLAKFVHSYLEFLGVEVKSILDVGCGVGLWQRALGEIDRRVEYIGIDTSEYLCEKYGWTCSSIVDFKSRRKFDLVICQDMLQYLNNAEVKGSIHRITRLSRGALYVEVPTREDFDEETLDVSRTDQFIHVRSVKWYRRILARHFTSAGGGVFLPNRSRTTLLALERG